MAFHPFMVTPPHLAYAFLGGFGTCQSIELTWLIISVVIFGLFSSFIKETLRLGEAPVATVVGIVIGPHALNLFNPYAWGGADNEKVTNEITLEVTRVVIALSVFAVGVELPKVPLPQCK
jgi:NhaP-type Na+/H+ or K+/H+ antiporter